MSFREYKFLLAFHLDKNYEIKNGNYNEEYGNIGIKYRICNPKFIGNVIGFRLLNLPSGKIEDVSLSYFIENKYHINGIDNYSTLSSAMRIGDELVIEDERTGGCTLYKISNGVKSRVTYYKNCNIPYLVDGKVLSMPFSFSRGNKKQSIIKLTDIRCNKLSIICDFMVGNIKFEYNGISLLGSRVKSHYNLSSTWEICEFYDLLPHSLYYRVDRLVSLCGNKCVIESRRDNSTTLIVLKDVKTVFIGTVDDFDWGNIRNLILPPSVKRIVLNSSDFSRADGKVKIGVNANIPINELKNLIKSFSTQYKKIVGISRCNSIAEFNKVIEPQGIYVDPY